MMRQIVSVEKQTMGNIYKIYLEKYDNSNSW